MKDSNAIENKGNDAYEESKDRVFSAYETVKDNAESIAKEAKETAADLYSEGKKKVEHSYDAVCEQSENLIHLIKERPLTSILIASGIGLILSYICKK